jgi:hypothetical protein
VATIVAISSDDIVVDRGRSDGGPTTNHPYATAAASRKPFVERISDDVVAPCAA